jgi:hypothetical protein
VGRADRLARADEVLHPLRHERAERDLERVAGEVEVGVAAGRRVQVDPVRADADAADDQDVGAPLDQSRPLRARPLP